MFKVGDRVIRKTDTELYEEFGEDWSSFVPDNFPHSITLGCVDQLAPNTEYTVIEVDRHGNVELSPLCNCYNPNCLKLVSSMPENIPLFKEGDVVLVKTEEELIEQYGDDWEYARPTTGVKGGVAERLSWTKDAEMLFGNRVVVGAVSPNGQLSIKNYSYIHNPNCFRHITHKDFQVGDKVVSKTSDEIYEEFGISVTDNLPSGTIVEITPLKSIILKETSTLHNSKFFKFLQASSEIRVKIKPWNVMVQEYGTDADGCIATFARFTISMEKMLPADRIITLNENRDWKPNPLASKRISKEMVAEVVSGIF